MKGIFIFLLSIAAFALKAQDTDTTSQMIISGIITDTSKEPIAFAAVIAYNAKQEQVAGAQADMDGAYTLKVDCKTTGSVILKAAYWGYEDITIGPIPVTHRSLKKDLAMRSKLSGYDSIIIISCPVRLIDASMASTPVDTMIVSGVVTDKITKEAVPFAMVEARNLKDETIAWASTDFDGKYSMSIKCKAARYITLKASYLGYKNQVTGKLAVAPLLRKLNFELGVNEGVTYSNCTIHCCCAPMIDAFGNFRPISGEEYRRRP